MTVAPGSQVSATASCQGGAQGSHVTGGGGYFTGPPDPTAALIGSVPVNQFPSGSSTPPDGSSANAWQATAVNTSVEPRTLTVYAVCTG